MNEIQTKLLAMLKDIARILESHDIPYFVHYGSSIGALRHNGFIPWDDDIDLVIWEKDLQTVNTVLRHELDPNLYFYHIPSADTHPHVIFKTKDFESDLRNERAPFIDIFVLEPYPSTFVRRMIVDGMIWTLLYSIYVISQIRSSIIHKIVSWIPRISEKIAKDLSNSCTEYCTVYNMTFKEEILPTKYFESTFTHKFEDTEVPLPNGVETFLTLFYGDYMTPPPEEDRRGASGYPCSAYKDYLSYLKKNTSNDVSDP